jgi:glycosyltransferase involved in cell wall biosynthesis
VGAAESFLILCLTYLFATEIQSIHEFVSKLRTYNYALFYRGRPPYSLPHNGLRRLRHIVLPKLIYCGDVPVQASYHGSALLYRLLEDYPTDKLLILESNPWQSQEALRLKNVQYRRLRIGVARLLNSRFANLYGSWVLWTAERRRRKVEAMTKDFAPRAVLAVTHGYSWISAGAFAERRRLPLHLILHDDWLSSVQILPFRKALAEKTFAHYYNYATTRFCVSPAMARRYEELYGPSGIVLYPSRNHPSGSTAKTTERQQTNQIVVAYAGTINGEGYVRRLRALAAVLDRMRGTLILYGPLTEARAKELGLDRQNIILRGLLRSHELIDRLRKEADLLFVPMSFQPQDRTNMELSFPSKLTDYTEVGLPLLINGPDYCSAVRWARQEPGVAEIVVSENDSELTEALIRIIEDPGHRQKLSEKAIEIGDKYFSHRRAIATFVGGLTSERGGEGS